MPHTHITEKQYDIICQDGKPVVLTSDDIITLKQVRDKLKSDLFEVRERYHRYEHISDRHIVLETLERILKQIQ